MPTGGQFDPKTSAEADLALEDAASNDPALAEAGYAPPASLPAGLPPASTAYRREWCDNSFALGEYGNARGDYQMPDDFTPQMTVGRSLEGNRRTHRMCYRGAGVTLRMPSVTAIKRYAAQFPLAAVGRPSLPAPEKVGTKSAMSAHSSSLKSPWTANPSLIVPGRKTCPILFPGVRHDKGIWPPTAQILPTASKADRSADRSGTALRSRGRQRLSDPDDLAVNPGVGPHQISDDLGGRLVRVGAQRGLQEGLVVGEQEPKRPDHYRQRDDPYQVPQDPGDDLDSDQPSER